MLDSLKPSDWVIVFATLAGPVLAVQAQKWVERATERRRQRYSLFSTLMITRGTIVAPEHVAALNSIDLVFAPSRLPWRAKTDAAVIESWRLYLQHLNTESTYPSEAAWNIRTHDLFVVLLMTMARAVGFKAEQERVQRAYLPKAHFNVEQARLKALDNAAKVLSGEQPIKMAVVDFPYSPEASELQQKLQTGLLALVADGTIKVTLKSPFNK